VLGLGRVGEDVVADAAIVDDVVAQAELLVDDRRQRLDAVGVDLAELLDPAQNVVELGQQPVELLVAHRDARQFRDVAHLFGGN
jgi:hypothetical protein